MGRSVWCCGGWIGAVIGALAAARAASAAAPTTQPFSFGVGDQKASPAMLMAAPEVESVYAPPEAPREEDGVNNGGVNLDFTIRYLTDYVYRGISHNRAVGGDEHASNFQADTLMTFNLGRLPHPYVGVFANVNDSDPISRFQEIRPVFGLEYTLRPIILNLGHNTYIYPERERLTPSPNTSEVFIKVTVDDSYFFLTPQSYLSPYIFAAYDYQVNNGWYLEAGVKHDFIIEDAGVTLTTYGDVGYISNFPQQFVLVSDAQSGFQHYDLGLIASLSLNHLFNLKTPRFGQFAVEGYLTYTGRFSNQLLADSIVWGGVGLSFKY